MKSARCHNCRLKLARAYREDTLTPEYKVTAVRVEKL